MVTRCKINRSNSIHVGNESDLIKETRDSKHKKDSSHFSVEVIGTCRSNKDIIAKCSNTYSISKEAEMEDFEEGQLIEEPDAQETAVKINFNPDGRSSASSPNAATSLHPLLNNKMNLDYPLQSNNLVGRYDRNHLLETLAKMERRRQRFKDPIPPKKASEISIVMQPDSNIEHGMKQQRPTRKRRWGCS
ncbi:hypothetical protein HPP92_016077 [Vanilla planifolia]|uniref:Uncharacterized protein n=1 Tax=Vanilla planifolia TaxID=51239 RepID=A0A835UVQ0_VANPL|nr:hypothetical protein HPP92_016077 [Vanilla planifolia]